MKHFTFLFFQFFLMAGVFCQSTHFSISGKVIDKNTGNALQGASVFAQNTTLGMATNAEGKFNLSLPNGGYDLVITFTGYTTESLRINNATALEENLTIALKPKEKSLEEVSVIVTSEVKDGWQKYGQLFTDNFIGKSIFSKQTSIKNPEVLKFFFSKKRNRLKVIANEPLVVVNDGLGYYIKFSIDSFTHDFESNVTQFIGYPLFEEIQGTADMQASWQRNRNIAYKGSMLHFMRSFYNRTLPGEGFEIQFLVNNNDRETSIQVKDPYLALNYAKDDSLKTVEFIPNQPNVIVIYNKAKPQPAYFDFDPGAKKDFQVSTVSVAPGESIIIEQNGYFFDQTDVTTNGYWGFEKIGDMLPYDYVPGN